MRIIAITVCISFSDALSAMLPNRAHFDEWIVVTVPDDEKTQALCENHTIRCCVATHIRPGELGFHAAFQKSSFLNIGIRRIDDILGPLSASADDWILIIDADVMLPHDFRSRVEALRPHLYDHYLYGIAGRRVVGARAFDRMRCLEPWALLTMLEQGLLGYFNLFSRRQKNRFYPSSDPKFVEHDDARFCKLFRPEERCILPITALHLGSTAKNWDGRKRRIEAGTSFRRKFALPRDFMALRGQELSELCVQVGFWDPEVTRALSSAYQNIHLSDRHGLLAKSTDALLRADRHFVLSRYLDGLPPSSRISMEPREVRHQSRRKEPGFQVLAAPATVNGVHIDCEPTLDVLLEVFERWVPKLHPSGWITGRWYGHPGFPDSTRAIHLLLGTPSYKNEDDFWAIHASDVKHRPVAARYQDASCAPSELEGLALWVYSPEELEPALIALSALRRQWTGPLCVINWGNDSPALKIGCALHSCEYVSVGTMAQQRDDRAIWPRAHKRRENCEPSFALLLSLNYTPFRRTLLLTPNAPMPDTHACFRALRRRPPVVNIGAVFAQGPVTLLYDRAHPKFTGWMRRLRRSQLPKYSVLHNFFAEQLQSAASTATNVKQAAGSLSDELERCRFNRSMGAHVWVPPSVTIVAAVEVGEIEALQNHWNAIAWSPGVERLAVPMLATTTGYDWAPEGSTVLNLPQEIAARRLQEPSWCLAIMAAALVSKRERLIYLDPWMRAAPGARLFSSHEEQESVLCGGGWTFSCEKDTLRKMAKVGPPASSFDTMWLRRVVKLFLARRHSFSFEAFINAHARRAGKPLVVRDLMEDGWNQ
jgi:hypothetical protein